MESSAHAFAAIAFTRPSDPAGQWFTRTLGESVCVFTEVGEACACPLHRAVRAPSAEGQGHTERHVLSGASRGQLRLGCCAWPEAGSPSPLARCAQGQTVSFNRASDGNATCPLSSLEIVSP